MQNVGVPDRHSAFGILHYTNAAVFVLAVLFLAAHVPFLPASLEDLDSINFARGVQYFDVAHHQPHPPGYPLFILAAKVVHHVIPSEAKTLGAVSAFAGALSILALVALFRRLDPERCAPGSALSAALLAVTAPLYWFTASRPLSDMAGLAAALTVQALTLTATGPARLAVASFLAAFATGLRSQVAWLTVPLIVLTIARRPTGVRARGALQSAAAFVLGGLAWGVPLVALNGGPRAYWHAVFDQGAEDLTGVQMLWTTPTLHQLGAALYRELVAPWAVTLVAIAVIILAIVGAVRMARVARPALVTLAAGFGPYLVFDLLFQETVTTRYALPLVVPMAYLAVRGLMPASTGPDRPPSRALLVALVLAAFNAQIGGTALAGYASAPAPAFRLLADMRESTASRVGPSGPVLAMHRREDLDLRRPLGWSADTPRVFKRLPAPPQHEWLELVKYWNGGGRNEVWFVADPGRTDLALIDRASARIAGYRWPLTHHELLGGVRPDVMDWLRVRQPGWYLGEGWALTPETAGVALADGRGPDRAPIRGWIRRRHDALMLLVGGRNLSPGGPAARVTIAIDGRAIDQPVVAPGFFLRMLALPAGALDGEGDYATVSIAADGHVAIEQFDAQSSDRVVFGFGEGWNEAEFSTAVGPWRWTSDRSVLRVHAAGRSLTLTLRGEAPIVSHWRPTHLKVSAGGRVVAEETLLTRFDLQVRIPAALVAGGESTITIETDRTSVPAHGIRRSLDRRRLGLRVFECDLKPVS